MTHPTIGSILGNWKRQVEESRGVTVGVPLEEIRAIIAWVEDGPRRLQAVRRAARQRAIDFLRAQIPQPSGKKNFIHPCCRVTLKTVITELERPEA